MADPVSWGVLALTAVGTGATILGGVNESNAAEAEGQAKYEEAQYKAAIAARNKEIALQNADYEYWVGESEAQRAGVAAAERSGMIRAAQGASGLDVDFGSNQRVQESQQMVNSFDQQTIRANAARRAYGHHIEAESASASGVLAKAAGENAKTAASYKSTSSMLSTVGSVSSKWLSASQAGVFGGKSGTTGPNSLGGQLAWGT